MASNLPTIPRVVFTVIEPISLVSGFIGAIWDPAWFVAEQLPQKLIMPASEHSIVMAQQLGNMYLLMCLVGLAVLTTTSEIKVVRSYLIALWLGDIGHIAFTCVALGRERVMQPSAWNAMTWGNIGFTVFVFAMRSAYLTGFFGDGVQAAQRVQTRSKKGTRSRKTA